MARITGGKRVPKKMIKPFAGTSLIRILLEKLLTCKNLSRDKIYLSAYENELKEVAQELGIKVYNRSWESICDSDTYKCKIEDSMRWAYEIDSEYFLQVSACNPMLNADTIDRAIEFFQNNDIDSLFSVVKRPNFFFDKNSEVLNPFHGSKEYFYGLDTRLIEPVYEAAHSIYMFKTEYFRKSKDCARWSFTKNDPYLFEIPTEEAFDIDYQWQFDLAEAAYIRSQKKDSGTVYG